MQLSYQIASADTPVVIEHNANDNDQQDASDANDIDEESHSRHLQSVFPELRLFGVCFVDGHHLHHPSVTFLRTEAVVESFQTESCG